MTDAQVEKMVERVNLGTANDQEAYYVAKLYEHNMLWTAEDKDKVLAIVMQVEGIGAEQGIKLRALVDKSLNTEYFLNRLDPELKIMGGFADKFLDLGGQDNSGKRVKSGNQVLVPDEFVERDIQFMDDYNTETRFKEIFSDLTDVEKISYASTIMEFESEVRRQEYTIIEELVTDENGNEEYKVKDFDLADARSKLGLIRKFDKFEILVKRIRERIKEQNNKKLDEMQTTKENSSHVVVVSTVNGKTAHIYARDEVEADRIARLAEKSHIVASGDGIEMFLPDGGSKFLSADIINGVEIEGVDIRALVEQGDEIETESGII